MNDAPTARDPARDPIEPRRSEGIDETPEELATGRSDGDQADVSVKERDRRTVFLNDLIYHIDIVISCQIAVLYYLDCSLWRLMLRTIPQTLLTNIKTKFLRVTPNGRGQCLLSIVWTNVTCIFLHMVVQPPQGSEPSRGYINGGLLMNFVGEAAPASKLRLLILDVGIVLLQLLLLATVIEVIAASDMRNGTGNSREAAQNQDMDAEERGVRRSRDGHETGLAEESQADIRVDVEDRAPRASDHAWTGEMILFSFNPLTTMLRIWREHDRSFPSALHPTATGSSDL